MSLAQLSGTDGNLVLALLGLLFQLRVLDDEVRELPPQFLIGPLDLNLSLQLIVLVALELRECCIELAYLLL